jgi:hypothetical protein
MHNPAIPAPITIHLFDLKPVSPLRPEGPLRAMKARINRLWEILGGKPEKAAVAGGSVARALLGLEVAHCDLDLFVPASVDAKAVADRLRMKSAGGTVIPGSGGRQIFSVHEAVGKVDLVQCKSVPDAIARFDFLCCAVATDGKYLLSRAGALDDLAARQLTILRSASRVRVDRYLGLGLDISRGVLSRDYSVEQILAGKAPGVIEKHKDCDRRLGLGLNITTRIVDMRKLAAPGEVKS